eukprot:Clim_evm41s134 gene=Clim_evmTU41s134
MPVGTWVDLLRPVAERPVDLNLVDYVNEHIPKNASRSASIAESYDRLAEQCGINKAHTPPKLIPSFHRPKERRKQNTLLQSLHRASIESAVQHHAVHVLQNADFEKLWSTLYQFCERATGGATQMGSEHITYKNWLKVYEALDDKEKFAPFFKPQVFVKLPKNDHDACSVVQFFNYCMRRSSLIKTRIDLTQFDSSGDGYLTEQDLESYIYSLVEMLPRLNTLDESFVSYYVCTAVRKFIFFLDPMRLGHIKIRDLLTSTMLSELFELRDEDLPPDMENTNWFTAMSAFRVYGQYLALDQDQNGMLSASELSHYGDGTLTQTFINRLFEVCLTYNGEMDYRSYLDFVLAMENRKTPQALAYFYRVLDIRGNGSKPLTVHSFLYFFSDIRRMLQEMGQEDVNFEDVKDEIFDMVRPKDPYQITLKDLIHSQAGDVILNMLIDVNGFWTYDNREFIAQKVGQEMEGLEEEEVLLDDDGNIVNIHDGGAPDEGTVGYDEGTVAEETTTLDPNERDQGVEAAANGENAR